MPSISSSSVTSWKESPPLASRAELRVPSQPTFGASIKAGLVDFYFYSWRLVPANVIWAAVLICALFFALTAPILALPILVLLALPTAGIFRMAALIVRGRPVAFSDSLAAWRHFARRALAVGVLTVLITVVLAFNTVAGALSLDLMGWAFATLAAWGLVIVGSVALALWPLLLDPLREQVPLRQLLSLTPVVMFSSPMRYFGLVVLVIAFLVVSTILIAALLTISVAVTALVMSHYVLPTADRVENRPTQLVESAVD